MTQASRPQADNTASGFLDSGPYSADEWAERIALSVVGDPSTASERAQLRGVIPTVLNKLVVTNPAGVTIRVSTGAAWVNGRMLVSDATAPSPTDFTPSTPGANRIDRVVVVENNTNVAYNTNLEFPTDLTDYNGLASVPAYSARLAILTGVSGGAMRALVQTTSYWMVELARYTISAVPAISNFTDYREFAQIEHIVGVHSDDDDTTEYALIMGTQVDDAASGDDNLGVGIQALLEDSAGNLDEAGRIVVAWHDSATTLEVPRFEVWGLSNSGTEAHRLVILTGLTPGAGVIAGNARGLGSVDLSASKFAAAEVPSGNFAATIGGTRLTASGDYSAVLGGELGVASFSRSVVLGGYSGAAAGIAAAVLAGYESSVTANYAATIGGYYPTASGESSVASGERSVADKEGQVVAASGRFAADGDAQGTIQMVVRLAQASHAINTWYPLFLDGGTTPDRVTIAASTAWTVHVQVVGITQNAAQQWGYELIGLIERDNANNTTLAAQTQRVIFESDANYDAQLAADDANEALEVQVRRTGGADYDVRWVATIRMAEVTYP